jgi:replicative DNA helicase
MTFGMDLVDTHTYGIHEGEMAVLAAGPKVGKSTALGRIALNEWAVRGRNVVLVTLENSVEMTLDRLVCFHLGLNPRGWQRGELPPAAAEKVQEFIEDVMPTMAGSLHVIQSSRGSRTPEMMVREAKLLGAQSVLIDQLTHVEHPNPGRMPRHEQFNENIHEFADLCRDGDPIALLLAHQINRAGVESSKKLNYLEMHHLAESAGVERAADWVFGLHQSPDERIDGVAKFQIMAARREDVNNWEITWDPELSYWRATHEIELGADA